MLWVGWGLVFGNFFFIHHVVCSSQEQKKWCYCYISSPLFRSYETRGLVRRQGWGARLGVTCCSGRQQHRRRGTRARVCSWFLQETLGAQLVFLGTHQLPSNPRLSPSKSRRNVIATCPGKSRTSGTWRGDTALFAPRAIINSLFVQGLAPEGPGLAGACSYSCSINLIYTVQLSWGLM